ncbi:cation:proton antiporter [Ferrimicrobium acidiphilum]|uniref:cation:proton antiporter domain-containing protein n=2 Tax=Ferrimicrobium acidiphilum TaxID=121039 RepID=UPI0023F41895|nr:cation:proton antiporter [Ferrimicrobium acidiphilum]MCL5053947.1 cation:proton antiporter [Gammaproteobacteria bacterium]
MVEAVVVIVVGLAIGTVPPKWLRLPEPMVLLAIGALLRVALGGHANEDVFKVAAYIGLFALLFGVGVELSDLGHRPLTPLGLGLASIGAIILAGIGIVTLLTLQTTPGRVALAIILSSIPTSAGIAARLIRPHGTGDGSGYATIISAAVADDFFGITLLVLAPLLAVGASLDLTSSPSIALVASVIVVVAMLLIRPRGTPLKLVKLSVLTIAGIVSGVSAALLGVFDGHETAPHLPNKFRSWLPTLERLLPTMFFMVAGYDIHLSLLAHTRVLLSAALIVAALLISRLVIAVATPGDLRVRLAVGAGMLARGEVTIAMALVFLQSGVISSSNYASLMAVVLASTALSAMALRLNRLRR